jgi:hypothetical protein
VNITIRQLTIISIMFIWPPSTLEQRISPIYYKEVTMIKHIVILLMAAGVVVFCPAISKATEQENSQKQVQKQEQKKDQIYGSQLMTPEERAEHRAKMRSLKTREEREAYRLEHHKKMQERAREKGVALPDEPPVPGGGMGPGGGGGRGPGGGR